MTKECRIGTQIGVYTVIDRKVQTHGHQRLWLKCSICGKVFDREKQSLAQFERSGLTDSCNCERISKQKKRTRIDYNSDSCSKRNIKLYQCRKDLEKTIEKKTKKNPNYPHDSVDDIFRSIPEMPDDTDIIKWKLQKIDDAKGHIVGNFEWKAFTKTKAINVAVNANNKFTQTTIKDYVKRMIRTGEIPATLDALEQTIQMRQRVHRAVEDDDLYIGRTYGSFKVVGVQHSYVNGAHRRLFEVVCKKCGKHLLKTINKLLDGVRCRCHAHLYKAHHKNSSCVYGSTLLRKRLNWIRKKSMSGLDPDSLELMRCHIGEFSLTYGTESRMNADLELYFLEQRLFINRWDFL